MRQGGFKPKSHNSGVYWIRANSGGSSSNRSEAKEFSMWDFLGILSGIIFFIVLLVFYA